MKRIEFVFGLFVAAMVLNGCTHNLTKLNERTVYSRTSDAQVASMDGDGNLQAAYHGIGPMQLMQDPNGNWTNMPGPAGILSFPTPQGVAFIVSPNNMTMAKFTYTPEPAKGLAAITVEGLEVNLSEPMSQQVAAITVALPVLQAMTKAEAEATVRKWEEAGDMLPSVIDFLKTIVAAM